MFPKVSDAFEEYFDSSYAIWSLVWVSFFRVSRGCSRGMVAGVTCFYSGKSKQMSPKHWSGFCQVFSQEKLFSQKQAHQILHLRSFSGHFFIIIAQIVSQQSLWIVSIAQIQLKASHATQAARQTHATHDLTWVLTIDVIFV